jgi:hypothetical protein
VKIGGTVVHFDEGDKLVPLMIAVSVKKGG